jgi:CRP/FNR family transcriptional regulator
MDDNVLNLSREDLANIVGSATETIIRLLSEFREENLIAINGRKIILKDVKRLKKIASFD